MSWNGIFFGALIGLLITRSAWGAAVGGVSMLFWVFAVKAKNPRTRISGTTV